MKRPDDAASEYAVRLTRARALLRALSAALDEHEKDQTRYASSWGPVGDLGHVIDGLADIARFLGAEVEP